MYRPRRRSRSKIARAFLLGLAAAAALTSAAAAQVVINEIDYDQAGTDSAEFIELKNVGTVTENLDGYSVELVNGSTTSVYNTFTLPAVALAAGEYFVICADAGVTPNCDLDVSPDTNMIQNGSPDAVALFFGGGLVDVVSYEGDTGGGFVEGSGVGLEDDPGVDFAGIARFPDGVDSDENNVDLSQRCITPGEANASATADCGAPGSPTLVINEIDYDQMGTDVAEFVEIKNDGPVQSSLDGVELVLVNGSTGSVYNTIALPAVNLPPGGYFVVCGDPAEVAICDLDASMDTNLIQNGSPDAVALALEGSILDTVSYEGDTVAPYTEGSGLGLEDDPDVDFAGISRFPDGVDTDVNNVDLSLRCATPGLPNSSDDSACAAADPPELVINEIDYDQPGGDTAEFLEIKNVGSGPADLSSVDLVLVNGSTGSLYRTIELPATELAAGDYFVVCAAATTTPECDLDVSPDSNLIQNGAPDAAALVFGSLILDAVSYEGDVPGYTETTGAPADPSGDDFVGLSRIPDGADSDDNSADFSVRCITPGEANTSDDSDCSVGPPMELEIWQIQGSGLASPFEGATAITNQNVVTAVGPDGFFMQTPEVRSDGDSETSDGIFVFTGSTPSVAVGDLVDVTATVQEFFELTELSGVTSLTVTGSASVPMPVVFDPTTPSPDQPQPDTELERFEGMLVIFEGVATAPSDQFGDAAVVAAPQRAFREPGVEFPAPVSLPEWDGNPEIFEIDPDALGLDDLDLFGGQSLMAEGPLAFAFGDYQVWPTAVAPGAAPTLPRPVRARQAGELTIATQNIERFFDDVDDPLTDDPVISTADYEARVTKVSTWIRQTLGAPDVLVVQEVENLGILEDLAAELAAQDPALTYSAWLIEGNDVGGIDVGMVTRDDSIAVSSVTQFGADTIFDFDGSLLNDRPPLVMQATYTGSGAIPFDFTLIGVHQRSLGGIEGSQATRVRLKRFEQARQLSEFLQDLQTTDPDTPLLVAGDFNAFQFTDGYVDIMGQVTGNLDPLGDEADTFDAVEPDLRNEVLSLPADERYSFVFAGSAQTLDHILTSSAAQVRVTDVDFARGNADAAERFESEPLSPLRISDHDGLVVFLASELDADDDGVGDGADLCPETMIPEAVPTRGLNPYHYALTDGDATFDSLKPNDSAPDPLTITTSDTAGCSCGQIIDGLGLGNGQTRFGCSEETMLAWIAQVGG